MFISGLFSTMNVWTDKMEDIRFSLNDLYMIFLMTGWMFLITGLIYKNKIQILIGLPLIIFSFVSIRYQFLITDKQFLLGMIPHHSMAVHMSKQLVNKETKFKDFAKGIIHQQEKEIEFMKRYLSNSS
jgi:hypothetical protein